MAEILTQPPIFRYPLQIDGTTYFIQITWKQRLAMHSLAHISRVEGGAEYISYPLDELAASFVANCVKSWNELYYPCDDGTTSDQLIEFKEENKEWIPETHRDKMVEFIIDYIANWQEYQKKSLKPAGK